ncbi:hypothetical protein COU62_03570 [Candidatus Pacearchaeota archaeon CG10_big_fil_rev_8_21_14_0_10_35_219]|nr:NUDIX hydrolase [Candidatus Pacearchaeota archaeon]OIO42334.1 MAG: hypothetical protein AUJ63_03605 [Candidatus Pacearchaeota archaeon CG1_02_35_32]PIO07431.1 MAG: hypothetical protein COU62_03570 [Candidatus Pacearchaeota archaeon CG10_big_fil_rev_8_21_14_0_10_35_219]PIY81237.1 MAG: hypothetical protein COY79_03065 [Candidatus Pacearchaeota archaeon CG_4_10_14_0_8_um_filter_35_169]PJA69569.1 MAG: hypothetical protein CO155_04835 [Candidatus Pacearchaeota archaeon CG_4_9_14_3_um_filter_35_19
MKPYRKNCEGYFMRDRKVLAKERGKYVEFPGDGVEEDIGDGLIRETLEETGYKVGNLKKLGVLHF